MFLKSTNYYFLFRLYQQSLQKYTHIDNQTSITLQRTYHEKTASNDSELSQYSFISTLSLDEDAVIEPITENLQTQEVMSDKSILSELGNQFFETNNQSQNYYTKGNQHEAYDGQDDLKSDRYSTITNVQLQTNNGRHSKQDKRRNSQYLNASQSNCSYKINNSSNISRGHKRKTKHTDQNNVQVLATRGPMTMGQIEHTIPKVHIPQLKISEVTQSSTNAFINTSPRQFFDKHPIQKQSSQLHVPIIGTPRKPNNIDQQFQNAVKQMQHGNQGAKLLESIGFQLGEFIALQDYPLIYKFQQTNMLNYNENNSNNSQQPKNISFKRMQQVENVDQKVEYCFINVDENAKQFKLGASGNEMNTIRYGTMLILYNLVKYTPQSQQQIFEQLFYPILYDIIMMRKNRKGADKIQINSLYAVILQIFKQQTFKLDIWNTAMNQIFEYVDIEYKFLDTNTDKIVQIEEEDMKVIEKKLISYPQKLSILPRLEGYRRNILPVITYLGLKLQQLCLFYNQISAVEEVIILLGTLTDISIITDNNTYVRSAIIEQCLPSLLKILNYLINKQFKSRQYYIFISNKILQLFNNLMIIKDSFIGDQQQNNINQIFINIFFYQKIQVLPWLKRYAYLILLNPKIIIELSGVFLHIDQCEFALQKYQVNLCQFFSNLSQLINYQLFKSITNQKFKSPNIEQCVKNNDKIKTGNYSNFQKENLNSDESFKLNLEISQLPLQQILQLNQLEYNKIIRLSLDQEYAQSREKIHQYQIYMKEFLFLIDYQYGVLMQYLLLQQDQIMHQQKNRQIYVNVLESLSQLFSINENAVTDISRQISLVIKQLPRNIFKQCNQYQQRIIIQDYLIQQVLKHNGYDKDNIIAINQFTKNAQLQNVSLLMDINKRQPTMPLTEYQIDLDKSYTCTDSDGWGETARRLGIDLEHNMSNNVDSNIPNQIEQQQQQQTNFPKLKLNMQQLQQQKYTITNSILDQNQNQKQLEFEIEPCLNIQIVLFILSMIIDPCTEMFDSNYVVQFPLNKNVPNIPIILHKHLNNNKNKNILQQLLLMDLQPAHQRLIRLLTNTNFSADLYPLQFFDLIASTKNTQTFKGHLHLSDKITSQNQLLPIIAKTTQFSLNCEDLCTIYNVYNEVTIMEKVNQNKQFSQLVDYGIYGNQEYIIVMHQYFMSFRKFRLSLFNNQNMKLSQYGHEQSLVSYVRILLMSYINLLKIIQRMHELNIIHMDIKCENLFIQPASIDWLLEIDKIRDECDKKYKYQQVSQKIMQKFQNIQSIDEMPYQLILGDFGESLIAQSPDYDISDQLQTQHGTEFNKSPEMLFHHSQNMKIDNYKSAISSKTDIWSAACTLYEMLTGDFLFYDTEWSRFYINVTKQRNNVQLASQTETFGDAKQLSSRIRGIQLSTEKQLMLGNCMPLIDLLEFQLVQNPDMRPSIQQCIYMTEHVLKKYFLATNINYQNLFSFKINSQNFLSLNIAKMQKIETSDQRNDSDVQSDLVASKNNSIIQVIQSNDNMNYTSDLNNLKHLGQVLLPIQSLNDNVKPKQGPSCSKINKRQLTQQPIDVCNDRSVFVSNNRMQLGYNFIVQNNIQTIIDCRQFKTMLKIQKQQKLEMNNLQNRVIRRQKRSQSISIIKSSFLKPKRDRKLFLSIIDDHPRSLSRTNMSSMKNTDEQILSQSYSKENNRFIINNSYIKENKKNTQRNKLFRNETLDNINLTMQQIDDNIIKQSVQTDGFNQQLVARVYQPRELLSILSRDDSADECSVETLGNSKQYEDQGFTQEMPKNAVKAGILVKESADFKNFMLSLEQLFGIIRCSIITGGSVLIVGDDFLSAENISLCWLMEFKRLGIIDSIAIMKRKCPEMKIHSDFFIYMATWDGLRAKTGIRLLQLQSAGPSRPLSGQKQLEMITKYPEMCELLNLRLSGPKFTCACRKTFFTVKPNAKLSYNICNCVISDEYKHIILNEQLIDCPTTSCRTIINYYQSLFAIALDRIIYALVHIDNVVGNYHRTTQQVQQIKKFTDTDNYQLQYRIVDDIRAPLARIAIKDGWYLHTCTLCGSPTHFLNENSKQICIVAVFENI